jgi:hypothetical protein
MKSPRNPKKIVRVLVSNNGEPFNDHVTALMHLAASVPVVLVSVMPATTFETDLLETAARNMFDLAILFLNSVEYSSGDRGKLEGDSVGLVEEMLVRFQKPVICIYSWPDSCHYRSRLLNAGAVAALPVPYDVEDLRRALRRCLAI